MNEPRKRILLLIPHLGGGGAEKVVEQLARGLSSDHYEIHLGLVTRSGTITADFPCSVQIHALGATRVRWSTFRLLRLIRQLQPQLILSGMAHLNFLVLFLRPLFPRSTRILTRQNTTVSSVLNYGRVPFYTRLLYRHLLNRADRILCQSNAMAEDLQKTLHILPDKTRVLLNPIEIPVPVKGFSSQMDGDIQFLAVGRLAHEKGFDLLLHAFGSLLPKYPDLQLRIAGAGPEEANLRALCARFQLNQNVNFSGFHQQPFAGAHIFVLSSRFEGMPNALLEAAAHGLPIVSTPCSDGVVELLRNQPGAWLADSTTAADLAIAMEAALAEVKPGQRFEHKFLEPFRFARAIKAYERLIDEELSR